MRVGGVLAVGVLAVTAAGCGSGGGSSSGGGAGAGGTTSVTLAEAPSALQTLPIEIAREQGFFKKHGLNVKVSTVAGGAAIIAALQSGAAQFASATATPVLAANKQGGSLQMLSALSTYPEQIVISTKKAKQLGITDATPLKERIQKLKGLSVGVLQLGGGLQYTLDYALQYGGLKPKEVKTATVTPYVAMMNALHAGKIDAIAPSAPYGDLAVQRGDGVMVANIWQGQVPSLPTKDPFQVLAINSKYAKGHPKVMEAMRASLLDAYSYMRANLEQTYAEATKVVPGFTTDLMKQAIGTGESFPSGASISEDQLTQIIAFSKSAGVDVGDPTYAQAVYPPSGS
jgi:ABC-type nitrate/sulfonate/bicarbonate transport system substrate-binding protein